MARIIKSIVRRVFSRFGYEIQPISHAPSDAFLEQRRLLAGNDEPVIFDVGAHRGESVLQYKTLFPAATVYCFEPFPQSFAALQGAIAGLASVQPFNVALSDRAGHAEFNSNKYTATNSLLTTASEVESAWPGGIVDTKERIRVATTSLDDFCRDHSVSAIDLLKLDVQGAEPLVLKGGEQLLRQGKVRMIFTEILTLPTYNGQADLHEFLRMMRDYGFEVFNFFNLSTTTSGQLRQLDAIFTPTNASR
jgi:FkbM family methyltransferase